MKLQGLVFLIGLRVFDVGALIVWLVWFFKLRDDDDDDTGGDDFRGDGDPARSRAVGPRRPRHPAARRRPVAQAPARPRRAPARHATGPPRRPRPAHVPALRGARRSPHAAAPNLERLSPPRRACGRFVEESGLFPDNTDRLWFDCADGSPHAGSHLLRLAGRRRRGAAGDARVRRHAQDGHATATARPTRSTVLDLERRLADLRPARRPARDAQRRRRAAPLRLERLLVGAVPVGAAPARRAALPARARPALVAHPRRRRQATTRTQPAARQGDRGRGDRAQDRLQPPAHRPLRPRRDLRHRARQRPTATGRAASSCSTTTRFDGQGRVGGRPRAAGARLRLLVAPQLRHA